MVTTPQSWCSSAVLSKSVGFSSNPPIAGQRSGRLIAPEGYIPTRGEGWNIASNYLVYGNYFEAMRIPLIRRRYSNAADHQPGAPLVLVISQMLADPYFHPSMQAMAGYITNAPTYMGCGTNPYGPERTTVWPRSV
jgi:hypothetical protein